MNPRYDGVDFTGDFKNWLGTLDQEEHDEVLAFLGGVAGLEPQLRASWYLSCLGQQGRCTIWMGAWARDGIDYRIYFTRPLGGRLIFLCGAQVTGDYQDLDADARRLARTVGKC